jgi:glucose/arabinose dehydrogenase
MKTTIGRVKAGSVLAGVLVAGSVQTAQAQTAPDLWKNNCASCHGGQGQGTSGVPSLLDGTWSFGSTPRDMFDAVRKQHDDKGDAAKLKNLKDQEVWATINHLHMLRAQDYRRNGGGAHASDAGVYTTQHATYKVEDVITTDLDTPWAVEFIPADADGGLAGAMLITEKNGRLRVFKDGKLGAAVEGIPEVSSDGQGGLLGIAIHPRYKENGLIYLSYAEKLDGDRNKVMTKIVRGRLTESRGGSWAWSDQRTIFQARPEHYVGPGVHYGCRIVFDPKDSSILYFAIGERGRQVMAQDTTRPNGKVHRVRDDGAIPQDNPFATQGGGVYKSIWSFGHRNPQGLIFDLEGNLWDTEHGPQGGDELNMVLKGRNYGWPVVTYGINYGGNPWNVPWPEFAGRKEASLSASDPENNNPDAITMPVHVWLPSIAVCGLTCSTGGVFPDWKGDLFAGGLAGQTVERLRVKDGKLVEREEVLFEQGRVRDVVCGPDGSIYVALNGPDKIVKLTPAK